MRELVFGQPEDGSKHEQRARCAYQGPRQVVFRDPGESVGCLARNIVGCEKVRAAVERCLMDIRKVGRQVREVECPGNGGEDAGMLAGPVMLGDQPNLRDSLIPTGGGDDAINGFVNRGQNVIPPTKPATCQAYRSQCLLRSDAGPRSRSAREFRNRPPSVPVGGPPPPWSHRLRKDR